MEKVYAPISSLGLKIPNKDGYPDQAVFTTLRCSYACGFLTYYAPVGAVNGESPPMAPQGRYHIRTTGERKRFALTEGCVQPDVVLIRNFGNNVFMIDCETSAGSVDCIKYERTSPG